MAAEAEISAGAAFVLLSVAGELYGNWKTEMTSAEAAHRSYKRMLAVSVVEVTATPGLLRTVRRHVPHK